MKISVELINAILNYLSKKPFNEVNGLVLAFYNHMLYLGIVLGGTYG